MFFTENGWENHKNINWDALIHRLLLTLSEVMMRHHKYLFLLTVAAIAIFLSSVFCSVFQPGEEEILIQTEIPEKTIDQATSLTPTLEPTNKVKIKDSGAPLPPKIVNWVPSVGQEIGTNGVIEIQFDQPMDQNATSAALRLIDPSGKTVRGNITWPQPTSLLFSPSNSLTTGDIYKLHISTEARSINNSSLVEEFTLDVTVASNLMVSQVFPADGTKDVESNAVITVIFNRPIVPIMSVEDQADLVKPLQIRPDIAGTGSWINTSVYVFQPEQTLFSSTEYSVKIDSGLEDMIGSTLQDPYEWKFTTAAPSIASYGITGPVFIETPKNNIDDVRLDSYFQIDFHQPMDDGSVEESFSLSSFSGEAVPVRYEWKTDYQVIITPTKQLDLGTDFTFLLSQNARAATGGELSEELRWNFRTLSYPTIKSTFPKDGEVRTNFSNRFAIYFSSPMKLETIKERIEIKPEPEETLNWYYDPWGWTAEFYGLNPSTSYSVVVEPGIEDIYGNKIKEPYAFQFRTGRLNPGVYLDMPYMPSIYRLGGPMNFYLSYVNLKTVDVDLYKIPINYFVGFNSGTYNRWDFVPPDEWWVNSWQWDNTRPENEIVKQSPKLRTASDETLEPGFYFITINSPEIPSRGPHIDNRLLVIAEANLTFKSTQTEALLWLTDLDSGNPLSDITLSVYDYQFNEIGVGSTDSNGLLFLDLPEPDEAYQFRYAVSEEGKPFAFAISDWGSGASPYEFGIWSNYYSLPEQPLGYVYTDRPLYRPGQTVYFKGILRQNDDLQYSLLPWEEVEVEINSYNESVYKEVIKLSEYGTFDGELTLDNDAPLGYYSIQVRSPLSDEGLGGVSFSVAEYRKPEFQVTIEANPKDVLFGETFQAVIFAEYYSGGGVGNADVEWAIRAVDYIFQPEGDLGLYTYNNIEQDTDFYYSFMESPRSEIIANGKGKTDENGELELVLSADLTDVSLSQILTLEVSVSDIAETTVSDRVNIIAHKSAVYPGIKPSTYVGIVGEEQSFEIILLDWDSIPIPNYTVDVEVVEHRWYSIQEQDPQGFVRWTSAVEEIPVANFPGVELDFRGKAKVGFVPERGGIYKAKVTAQDENGNLATAGTYLWVSDSDFVAWRQTNDRKMELVVDNDSYSPGEIAEILIASPLVGDNYALVTVERGHIRQFDVIRLASNSTIYKLPITADMAPNIYFSVIVIQGAEVGEKPDFRMGLVQIDVAKDEQVLNVEIEPDIVDAGPGDEVTYLIRTSDFNGDPARADVSIALVDLANLSLIEPNSRPIHEYFYDQQSLNVMTSVPIVLSIEDYISTLEDRLTSGEGMGSGGGKGADVYGVMDIRGDFRDTAFWQARVITDQNGEARVTVKLPDNLTIWRMDARAVTIDTLVGSGENDLRSTKPLLVRPQTPRFFVAGDQSTLGAAVHNNTENELSVSVSLEAEGLTLDSLRTQSVKVGPGDQAYLRWEVTVNQDVDRVDLIFTARSGKYTDASRPTMGTLDGQGIPVYRYEAIEIIGTAGILTDAGSKTEGVQIPISWESSRGDLTVKISPSLVAGMTDGLDFLKHYPYECIEQTISRFLPNVLTTKVLETAGLSDPKLKENLNEQVNMALQRLYNWQRPDGGWGWWPDSPEGDTLTSSYVILGLVEAKSAGYHINQDTLNRSINYLKGKLKSLGKLDEQYLLNRQAFMLYVLAKAENPQVSLTSAMYDSRQSLSLYARAYLAEALWLIDPNDPRLETLLSDFNSSAIVSATGTYWQEDWRDYWNWNTDTRTTATILATLIKIDPDNGLNFNAVRWLMAHRTKGHWSTTQETAWSLMALTNWIEATGELNAAYDWAVGVNNIRLGDGSANQRNLTITSELQVELSELFLGEINRVTIARDDGVGSLYYTAHMNIFLPVERIEPLDRGIMISREYFLPAIDGKLESITQASQGDLLLARLTLVVPHDLHYVIVDDPLPAGLEAVDQSLETNPEIIVPKGYDFESIWKQGWGWWYFDHVKLHDERIVISADYLPAGTYVYTYIVRASTPGIYHTIPVVAHEFYFPEVYGRGVGSLFTVLP